MKKLLFLLLPILLPILAISCTNKGGYTIVGTTPEGVNTINLIIFDTTEVVNEVKSVTPGDEFSFKGKLEEFSTARLVMKNNEKSLHTLRFEIHNEKIVILQNSGKPTVVVESNKIGKILDSVYASESENASYKVIDSLLSINPADSIVPYIFNKLNYDLSLKQYDSIMAKVDPSIADNLYFAYSAPHFECLRKTDVGKPFTDFICPQKDGQSLQLSSIAGKGNWILVDFWASWCRPCRMENKNVVAVYRKFHDKGFDILGVSADKDKTKWIDAIEKDSLSWTHVSDLNGWDSPSMKTYGINAIPANILIAPDGTIAARNLYGPQLDYFLSEILK